MSIDGWAHLSRPEPPGTYETALADMEHALEHDLPPSPRLIQINNRLAAWEAYLKIGKVKSFPSILHVALNDICNARCAFCIYSPERSTGKFVSAEDIRRAKWLKYVQAFFPNAGLSEPLVHPEITDILETVRENAPYINMHMTTNLSLLNDRLISSFVGHLSVLIVSLNAASRDTYEFLMPPLKWATVTANIRATVKAKQAANARLPEIQAGYVLNRHNFQELPTLPAVLSDLGVFATRIIEFAVPGPIASRKLLSFEDRIPNDRSAIEDVFGRFRHHCEAYGVKLTHPLPAIQHLARSKG